MNKSTAKHLNCLFDRAGCPLAMVHSTAPAYTFSKGTGDERDHMYRFVEQCRQRVEAQAVQEEIMRAAKERRRASVFTGSSTDSLIGYPQLNGGNKCAAGLALDLVMNDILGEIDRLNAAALSVYENYRLACEQGVAVPPAGDQG